MLEDTKYQASPELQDPQLSLEANGLLRISVATSQNITVEKLIQAGYVSPSAECQYNVLGRLKQHSYYLSVVQVHA